MATDKIARLQEAAQTIQKRFGAHTLHIQGVERVAPLATTFPVLDRALGIGGLPRGRITEFTGMPTSGMTTLALKIVGRAQAEGDVAVYVDLDRTFDPIYATLCGVKVEEILLVRPACADQGVQIAQDLIASGGTGILVLDLGMTPPDAALSYALGRVVGTLAASSCAFICLAAAMSVSAYTSVRLQIQRERWLKKRADVRGYRASVTVLKNKFAAASRPLSITINVH